MSSDWPIQENKEELKELGRDIGHRPVCPECGKNSIVLFTPPKEYLYPKDGKVHPDAYKLLGTPDYIDWEKAHLYCCNGQTNCKFRTLLGDLGKVNVNTPA